MFKLVVRKVIAKVVGGNLRILKKVFTLVGIKYGEYARPLIVSVVAVALMVIGLRVMMLLCLSLARGGGDVRRVFVVRGMLKVFPFLETYSDAILLAGVLASFVLILVVGHMLSFYPVMYLARRFGVANVRMKTSLLLKYLNSKKSFLDKKSNIEQYTLINTFSDSIGEVLEAVSEGIRGAIIVVTMFCVMLWMSWKMGLIAMGLIVCAKLLAEKLQTKVTRNKGELQRPIRQKKRLLKRRKRSNTKRFRLFLKIISKRQINLLL